MKRTYHKHRNETHADYLTRACKAAGRCYRKSLVCWGSDWRDAAEDALLRTERLFPDMGVCGVEWLTLDNGRELAYLNAGDTYAATVLAVENEAPSVGDWGILVEEAERETDEEEGSIRCGYCGERTPCAEEWRETVCEHCGRNVSTGEKPAAESTEEGE